MRVSCAIEHFAMDGTFTISRGSRTQADVIRVTLAIDDSEGHGECVPYARYGESLASVAAQIDSISAALSNETDHPSVHLQLPAGAARNALDCALWDLRAKRAGTTVAELAGVKPLKAVTSAFTIGIDEPDAMASKARDNAFRPLLKVKLGSPADLARLRAVRGGAPQAELIVDANEAWTRDDYLQLLPELQALGVTLIEQPFHAEHDDALRDVPRPIRVCADESCHDCSSLPALQGKYDMVNIKLDKTGGLTEALALESAARDAGFDIMVGCMVASSLAMAPAMLVAQNAAVVDLDGPLLLAEDRHPAMHFNGSTVSPAEPELWG